MHLIARENVSPFVGDDGSIIRELASPRNSALGQHSLAEIRHPPGTSSQEHYHTEAEEVYYVLEGRGGVLVDGETRASAPAMWWSSSRANATRFGQRARPTWCSWLPACQPTRWRK